MREREIEWARVMRLDRDGAEAGSRRVWREVGVVLGRAGLVLGVRWEYELHDWLRSSWKSSLGYLLRGHVDGLPVKKAVSFFFVIEVPKTVGCAELLRFLV